MATVSSRTTSSRKRTMLGWSMLSRERHSRRSAEMKSGSDLTCGDTSLTATVKWASSTCSPRQTSP